MLLWREEGAASLRRPLGRGLDPTRGRSSFPAEMPDMPRRLVDADDGSQCPRGRRRVGARDPHPALGCGSRARRKVCPPEAQDRFGEQLAQ